MALASVFGAVISIIFGVLVIAFPDILRYIVRLYFIIQGVIALL